MEYLVFFVLLIVVPYLSSFILQYRGGSLEVFIIIDIAIATAIIIKYLKHKFTIIEKKLGITEDNEVKTEKLKEKNETDNSLSQRK